MTSVLKAAVLWAVVIIGVFLLWSLFRTTKSTSELISFSTFLDRVEAGAVERAVIRGSEAWAVTRSDTPGGRREFRVVVPANYPAMYDLMREKGVDIELEVPRDSPLITAIITWAPVLFLIGLWLFFMRTIVKRKHDQALVGGAATANSQRPTANE